MNGHALDLRTWLFNLGAILIIFWSLIIGLINILTLYMAGIPLLGFLTCIILIWVGRASILKKTIFTVIPIPIIILILLFLIEINRPTPETFLIPQNYRGEFYVIPNEPCGESPVFEWWSRIYRIPENGALIVKDSTTPIGAFQILSG